MNSREQKQAAKAFVARWENWGNERQDSQSFWLDLLGSVYGIANPTSYIDFELPVKLGHTSYIDGYIAKTRVLIEQKGLDKDLSKAIKQSDGSYLTPYQQAQRYAISLPVSYHPRWVITCNFREFYIYDMERPNSQAVVVRLADLEQDYYRLAFLIDQTNEHLERELAISMEAGEIVGEIYDSLLGQYLHPDSPESLHAINQLIVRLVFCFYAEDAGIFGHKMIFHDYLARFESRDFRRGLIDLFQVLNTPLAERDPYLDEELMAFPYVNGGMFEEKNLEIPNFTDELRELILTHASSNFDWSDISPTIFGAVFESTLNPATRRSGGMHYTSLENIHKVIDPLFLDDLKEELNDLRQIKQAATLKKRAQAFQRQLAELVFFDPACGSGNFLTETYIALRRLENEAIKLYMGDAVALDVGDDLVQVKLNQFYGIEINDFAVSVAKTALWIAESQMLEATKDIVYTNIDFLPLKSYTNIIEGNALTLDWETVVPKDRLSYIIGNPPFVGARLMTKEQKEAVLEVFEHQTGAGNLDLVASWYLKSAQLMQGTSIRAALVSTNSITQGEQASLLWKLLMSDYQITIDFAYQTFKWESEAKDKAAVHCVIVGFSTQNRQDKRLFDSSGQMELVSQINAYLSNAGQVFIDSRNKPLSDVPTVGIGNKPIDGGFYLFDKAEMLSFIQKEPQSAPYFKEWYGAKEFINQNPRYCLWLGEASPHELRSMPLVLKRIEAVRDYRLASPSAGTRKLADKPTRFHVENMPDSNYLIIPSVSSENRKYIPIGFMTPDKLASNLVLIIPDASLYHFGILTSNVHMAWMRTVAGRLEMRYRYSAKIVYNNFPWPEVDEATRQAIEATAQAILDARKLYPDSSLADLYHDLTMPVELRNAHQKNDRAVMAAYGMTKIVNNKKTWLTENETITKLFELYEEQVEKTKGEGR